MANETHFVTSSKLKGLSVPAFKFNILYGKSLVADQKILKIKRVKISINDHGVYLVGCFSNISEFTFSEQKWNSSKPPTGNRTSPGGYDITPMTAPKPEDIICLQLEKKETEYYNSLHGLFFWLLDKNEGKIADSFILLHPEKYNLLAVESDGKSPNEKTCKAIVELAISKEFLGEKIYSVLEDQSVFDDLNKIEIPSNFGASGGYGSRTEIKMETHKEKIEARIALLEDKEFETKLLGLYVKYQTLLLDEKEEELPLYTGDFHLIDFLRVMLD